MGNASAEALRGEPVRTPLQRHIADLKRQLYWCGFTFIVACVLTFPHADEMIAWLKKPYHDDLIFYAPTEAIFAAIKVALLGGITLSMPVFLYHLWKFIDPAALARQQGRLDELPQVVQKDRHGQGDAPQQRHLDRREDGFRRRVKDQVVVVGFFEPVDHLVGVGKREDAGHDEREPAPVELPLEVGNVPLERRADPLSPGSLCRRVAHRDSQDGRPAGRERRGCNCRVLSVKLSFV